jgi:hypothetical protein
MKKDNQGFFSVIATSLKRRECSLPTKQSPILIMENIARYLVIGGVILILIGGGIYLAAKFGIPLGRFPGYIRIEGENGSFYFPITSSILVSVILTIVMNLIARFLGK